MSQDEARRAIEIGVAIVAAESAKGLDLVATGDMGIGNTTASSAIVAALTGRAVHEVTGRGTGIDDAGLAHKIEVVERALSIHQPDARDALDVLAKVGGFEIGGLVGVMLGAAAQRVPMLIDGFISGAAALLAVHLAPQVKDYLIAAHCSVEAGHRITLAYLGLSPLLELQMRLGEGTGAALAMSLAEAACKVLSEMATFDEASVSERIEGIKG